MRLRLTAAFLVRPALAFRKTSPSRKVMAGKHHKPKKQPPGRDMHDEHRRSFTALGTGESDGLAPVLPLDLNKVKTVDDLVRGLAATAFARRRTGEAADV